MSSDSKHDQAPYAPKINVFGHDRYRQCMRQVHDLGGEPDDEPIQLEESAKEQWEIDTYVTCECLAWRGVWNNVEKLRRHVDLGTEQYLSLPYYGRWLLSAARVMVDKEHVTVTELMSKMDAVKKRIDEQKRRHG